jgi:hypothetical protein
VADAITQPTPKESLVVTTDVPGGSQWRYFVEVNVSGDFNESFPERLDNGRPDEAGNGQPSLVYRGQIQAVLGQRNRPKLIGRTEQFRASFQLSDDLSGITTAKKLLTDIEMSCPAGNANRLWKKAAFTCRDVDQRMIGTLAATTPVALAQDKAAPHEVVTSLAPADAEILERGRIEKDGTCTLWTDGMLGDWFIVPRDTEIGIVVTAAGQAVGGVGAKVAVEIVKPDGKVIHSNDHLCDRQYPSRPGVCLRTGEASSKRIPASAGGKDKS